MKKPEITMQYRESISSYSPVERNMVLIDQLLLEKQMEKLQRAANARGAIYGSIASLLSGLGGALTMNTESLFQVVGWVSVISISLTVGVYSCVANKGILKTSSESIIEDIKQNHSQQIQGHSDSIVG